MHRAVQLCAAAVRGRRPRRSAARAGASGLLGGCRIEDFSMGWPRGSSFRDQAVAVIERRRPPLRDAGRKLWPALHIAGCTDRRLLPHETDELLAARCGVTNVNPCSGNASVALSRPPPDVCQGQAAAPREQERTMQRRSPGRAGVPRRRRRRQGRHAAPRVGRWQGEGVFWAGRRRLGPPGVGRALSPDPGGWDWAAQDGAEARTAW